MPDGAREPVGMAEQVGSLTSGGAADPPGAGRRRGCEGFEYSAVDVEWELLYLQCAWLECQQMYCLMNLFIVIAER